MDSSTYRERAGVHVSIFIVIAYVMIGFVQTALSFWTGTEFVVDPSWSAAMNALTGGAIGFLVGKQTTNPGNATTITTTPATVTTTVIGETSKEVSNG